MNFRVSLSIHEDRTIYINGGIRRTEDGDPFPIRAWIHPGEKKFGMTYEDVYQLLVTYRCARLDGGVLHPPKPEDWL